MKTLYAVEWSESQKSFHKCDIQNGIHEGNVNRFLQSFRPGYDDWFVLGVFQTEKESSDFILVLESKRKDLNL